MAARYDHQAIETAARAKWAELDLYRADLKDETRDPYYLLVEFPYPSGDLHIGHWYAFAVTDIYARMLRAQGKNVLFPIGFDAFGLPAENAAIKHGLDPKEWTYKNIERMRTQLQSMGPSFDWSKEVIACDPSYYKWTQWLFAKLFEHGLAERRNASVKWCPKDQTVLANEQVVDGTCERCGTAVEEKWLTQWFLKITDYADRLLAGLETLPWREEIKEAQRAWIGKSEGAKIAFPLIGGRDTDTIDVFTTRPDTIFGATYLVLAPEHPVVSFALERADGSVSNAAEVQAYLEATKKKTERERSENKEKTGVRLEGLQALNPATKEPIPLYVADYVLGSYGTGAVMAVPAHDERDFAFAQKMNLPIVHVIDPVTGTTQDKPAHKEKIVAIVEHGDEVLTINWKPELGGRLTIGGTANADEAPETTALREIKEETGYTDLELMATAQEKVHHEYFAHSKGKATIAHTTLLHFRARSLTHEEPMLETDEQGKFTVEWISKARALTEIKDPLHAYALARFLAPAAYTDGGVLARSGPFSGRNAEEAKWEIVAAVGGEPATNYRLRDWLVSRQRYWGCPIPIVYDPEGKPHAVPSEHLPWLLPTDVNFAPTGESPLASSKELKERVERIFGEGWTPEYDTLDTFVDSSWYFLRYLDSTDEHDFSDAKRMKKWLPVNRYSGGSEHTTMHLLYARFFTKALFDLALVPIDEPFTERFNRGLIMGPDGQKMSKSKGNVVNPDEFVKEYGADAVRVYLAFIGPYNEPGSYPWNLDGVASMRKFLERVARLSEKTTGAEASTELLQGAARTSAKVLEDGDRFKFNTGVAALMTFLNELERLPEVPRTIYGEYLRMLSPFAPHLTEYLWETLGQEGSIHQAQWPTYDPKLLAESEVELPVQVAGKRRGSVMLPKDAPQETAVAAARAVPAVEAALLGKEPSRVIYVPGKIINLVP